jgi:hypothetical protein
LEGSKNRTEVLATGITLALVTFIHKVLLLTREKLMNDLVVGGTSVADPEPQPVDLSLAAIKLSLKTSKLFREGPLLGLIGKVLLLEGQELLVLLS